MLYNANLLKICQFLLQISTNANLILTTAISKQLALILRDHTHVLVTLVGQEMGLLVKVYKKQILVKFSVLNNTNLLKICQFLLQISTNANLIMITAISKQLALILRDHTHVLVTPVGQGMGSLVKV